MTPRDYRNKRRIRNILRMSKNYKLDQRQDQVVMNAEGIPESLLRRNVVLEDPQGRMHVCSTFMIRGWPRGLHN